MKRTNGFFLFLSSCIPGCGQMHQGYMKRGVSLLLAACTLLAVPMMLYAEGLLFLLPVVWLYSFYDSYNLRRMTPEEAASHPDAFLFGLSSVDRKNLDALFGKRHSLLGWALVLLGVYLLLASAARSIGDLFSDYVWSNQFCGFVVRDVPRLMATFAIIALGIWFIRGPKKAAAEDDIPIFVPPAAQEAPAGESPAGREAAAPAAPTPDAAPSEEEADHGED